MNEKTEISPEALEQIIMENKVLQARLAEFENKSPIVGIRWYGEGGVTIRLNREFDGHTRVILEGYGAKAIIDVNTWRDLIRRNHLVQQGLLVRDDDVIKEIGHDGIVAPPDSSRNSNSFNDSEIPALFQKTDKQFNKLVSNLTSHQSCSHLLKVAKLEGINDAAKLQLLKRRWAYLLKYSQWDLLTIHEKRIACERLKIDYEGLSEKELTLILTEMDLKESSFAE